MPTATGKFEIKAIPLEQDAAAQRVGVSRNLFEKRFSGSLDGQSVVSMLGLMNKSLASGGYVAIERFEGNLDGRQGVFCLQHSSTMARGNAEQSILVIPDSATDDLSGLTGKMKIDIVQGEHHYTFEYALPQM